MSKFDELSKVLFGGEVIATDFKTMPGPATNLSRDHLANSLLKSLKRVGLVKDGKLVNQDQ